jgi:hypothetical protein
MIEHVALFRLHASVERSLFAAQVRIALSSLPGVVGLGVGLPADAAAEKSWDLLVTLRFANAREEAAALSSDVYLRCWKDLLEPSSQVSKRWSFELLG